MSDATAKKRQDLMLAVERILAPHEAVRGVVAVGSVAEGRAHADSDIDAVVFMEPVDPYIIPAESIWCPSDDSFHSIFTADARVEAEGIQLDLQRRDYRQWSSAGFEWPEADRAALTDGWLALDRGGKVQQLIAERTAYGEATRLARLDECLGAFDQLLSEDRPEVVWRRLGPVRAFGRLAAADEGLVQGLFALNGRWRCWRGRETESLCRLRWLPTDFERRFLVALNAPALDEDGYRSRVSVLRQLYGEMVAEAQRQGLYGRDPQGEAFVRSHQEPGRAWNMDEWNQRRHTAT